VTGRVVVADVADRPIAADELRDRVGSDADGALVVFEGVVRDHDGGRSVRTLDYEAHPDAAARIVAVAAAVAEEHPAVRVAVLHRVGALGIGDVALVAAVASAHRGAAFAACAALVDRVKAEVPIWKHQRFADGSDEWVGSA
jgi:molybdopterin synthase catalytic subunit